MESHCFHLLQRQIRWGAGLVTPKNTISPDGISWHFFFDDTYIITLQLEHEIVSVAIYSWFSGFFIRLKEMDTKFSLTLRSVYFLSLWIAYTPGLVLASQ